MSMRLSELMAEVEELMEERVIGMLVLSPTGTLSLRVPNREVGEDVAALLTWLASGEMRVVRDDDD